MRWKSKWFDSASVIDIVYNVEIYSGSILLYITLV